MSAADRVKRFCERYRAGANDSADGLKVVFYISHDDEQRTMKEAGLI